MYAVDFEYDGRFLSDFGFMICDFNSSGMSTVSAGSTISFNKVPMQSGMYNSLSSTRYDECIQTVFSICKIPNAHYDNMEVSCTEYKDLMRWLNRREFLKLHFQSTGKFEDDFGGLCFYEASFNVSKVVIDNIIYGLELTMETNRPFGYGKKQIVNRVLKAGQKFTINDVSDEIGTTYPDVKITIDQDGDFILSNESEKSVTTIKNCKKGEIIDIKGKERIIGTSLNGHHISNDFNYEFFRIGNTYNCRRNDISVSLPCTLRIEYFPIVKSVI